MNKDERNLVTSDNKRLVKRHENPFVMMYYMIKFSLMGIIAVFRDEKSFILHFLLGLLLPLGCGIAAYFCAVPLTLWEWAIVAGFGSILLSVEILNSAIENLADLATKEYNDYVKKAKDMGSAAVMAIGTLTLIFNLIIFGSKLIQLLQA